MRLAVDIEAVVAKQVSVPPTPEPSTRMRLVSVDEATLAGGSPYGPVTSDQAAALVSI
ncbi:hypothetical protein [Tardiphaga sp. 862_B3_N1_1]|uniref:hypothetical protein n=1 Tax=Tardiphaga sp. 862_B3_N1_1 TaxID=3240763 RepID=UPI003F8CA133